jgi:hypothetical protein
VVISISKDITTVEVRLVNSWIVAVRLQIEEEGVVEETETITVDRQ